MLTQTWPYNWLDAGWSHEDPFRRLDSAFSTTCITQDFFPHYNLPYPALSPLIMAVLRSTPPANQVLSGHASIVPSDLGIFHPALQHHFPFVSSNEAEEAAAISRHVAT